MKNGTKNGTKAITGALKRMEKYPNNDLSVANKRLESSAFENSWDNYDDFNQFPDAYQDNYLA